MQVTGQVECKRVVKWAQFRISIAINIPSMPALSMRPSSSELLGGVIENKHRTEKRRRRSEGVWGSICSFFDTDDWGWESYTTKVAVYEIDISKVKASIEKTLGGCSMVLHARP
ncbi:hypothetical protein PVE_P0385 (plasmid) [Pseudomonas veronii 1YdBTEX2]|uniref:Uncharacterized protein n=2 Tax=Pseudomonas veronii 1YdBTEX2 TaxID=1295141 RepID=A0A1D3KAX9_PSEVE|nr:hypothetical protein PVE_P0385 [Pseudomonas veronii 1YdBTEX2]